MGGRQSNHDDNNRYALLQGNNDDNGSYTPQEGNGSFDEDEDSKTETLAAIAHVRAPAATAYNQAEVVPSNTQLQQLLLWFLLLSPWQIVLHAKRQEVEWEVMDVEAEVGETAEVGEVGLECSGLRKWTSYWKDKLQCE
jgi:hypothetical protein